jgi:Flp pilus assembly protein TadB
MFRPPKDSRDGPIVEQPTWQRVFVSYGMMAAVFLSLWLVSNPLAGVVALAASAVAVITVRRAAELARCFRDCGGFAFDLGGRVRITVAQPRTEEAC